MKKNCDEFYIFNRKLSSFFINTIQFFCNYILLHKDELKQAKVSRPPRLSLCPARDDSRPVAGGAAHSGHPPQVHALTTGFQVYSFAHTTRLKG